MMAVVNFVKLPENGMWRAVFVSLKLSGAAIHCYEKRILNVTKE